MTFREAIHFGENKLSNAGIEDAKHDAWLLLTFICKIDRTFYYVHMDEDMPVEQVSEYENVLNKRAEHVPIYVFCPHSQLRSNQSQVCFQTT